MTPGGHHSEYAGVGSERCYKTTGQVRVSYEREGDTQRAPYRQLSISRPSVRVRGAVGSVGVDACLDPVKTRNDLGQKLFNARGRTRMILAGVGEPDQRREDCPSSDREIEAHGAEHLSRQTLRLTNEPKEQMLTAEVVMVQLERFLRHQVESVPSPGGGMGLAGWRSDQNLAHGAFQFSFQVARQDVHRHHHSQAQIPAFAEHPEEQVLGSDEAVVMAPCLVEGELDGLDETGRRPER